MENIKEINIPDFGTVKVWKMNYGFKSDMNGYIANVGSEMKGRTASPKININVGNMRLYWLVFAIYECQMINLPAPTDIEGGLSQAEIANRYKKVRMLDGDVAEIIYNEAIAINKGASEEEEEELKKE